MQGLAWVGSTVLLKFMLSTVFGASDDVSYYKSLYGENKYFIFNSETVLCATLLQRLVFDGEKQEGSFYI